MKAVNELTGVPLPSSVRRPSPLGRVKTDEEVDAIGAAPSLATRVMVPNRRHFREEGRHPFREWVPPLLATMEGSASLDDSRRQRGRPLLRVSDISN